MSLIDQDAKDRGNVSHQPRVSIVIPSFNQAKYLELAIRSVLDQDYPDLECIVIDGGSTDESREIIQSYDDRLAYWVSEEDTGQTDAINKGFARASGEVFAWLNSDDLYYPAAIAQAVDYLQSHPEVGMVYGDADFLDETGQVIGRFSASQTDHRRLRRGYVHIPQQASFFPARLWKEVGPLDPSFLFAMDYDLWVRISAVAPIRYLSRLWAGFRIHGAAKTTNAADRCWPEMIRVHRRMGGGLLAVIYAKYVVRRLLEPILPWRLKARLWMQQWALARSDERLV